MGLLRYIVGAIVVWFVWRTLDRLLGGGRRQAQDAPRRKKQRPDDERLGEYVDYEEIED
jgi:flagellar biosynthesis/type III secretory pathway M-ring protein FliF/YscJ